MTSEQEINLAVEECGMAWAGKNEDGENEFIGTRSQWEKFEQIKMGDDLSAKEQ